MELRLIVTTRCNFGCYFCLNEYYGGKGRDLLLLPQDYQYLTQIGYDGFGISEISVTGGEPLLREDFAVLMSVLKADRSSRVTLVTNGSLLEQSLDSLAHLDELHVSFHTFDDEEWKRITGRTGARQLVQANIAQVREKYPALRIKLNVVSEKANNSRVSIEQYLHYARLLDLEINVFKEGYLRIAKLLQIDGVESVEPAPMWNLTPFSASMIAETPRKRTYLAGGVKVTLSNTSTDESSWDSIWVGPTGVAYCSVFHDSPAIMLGRALQDRNDSMVKSCFSSLISEARYHLIMKNAENAEEIDIARHRLTRLIQQRAEQLPITEMRLHNVARRAPCEH